MALSSLQMLQTHPWHQTQCLQRMTPFEIFVCCILMSFYRNILLDNAENGDMNTRQTPSPWRHWRKYWSYWINLKCKQMDINASESWKFQCGGVFLMMSKCSILEFWFYFFRNSMKMSVFHCDENTYQWWSSPLWFLHYWVSWHGSTLF